MPLKEVSLWEAKSSALKLLEIDRVEVKKSLKYPVNKTLVV